MSDYSQFAQANPGTDYPAKDALLRAQLSLDSDKVDSGAVGHAFGYKRNTTAALNVGYYGGVIISGGVLTTIADGTVALTDATTNYVERTKAGVVSKNTVGFTAGQIPMFTAVTAAGAVTTVVDKRQSNVFGDQVVEGTMTAKGLVDLSGAAAGQIKFPASQNASADANTLDDYEEGTWTPSLGGTATYAVQIGTYTKTGRSAECFWRLNCSGIGTGSTNAMSGLPFADNGQLPFGGPVYFITGLASNVVSIAAQVSSQSVLFNCLAAAAADTSQPAVWTTSTGMYGQVGFFV